MSEKSKYFVVKQKAVPEVLLKVVEAKRLLESSKAITVQDATERVGISRSSFYKYKDDIFPFHDNSKGKSITFILQMDDEPGLLSLVLQTIAEYKGNVAGYIHVYPDAGSGSFANQGYPEIVDFGVQILFILEWVCTVDTEAHRECI